MKLTPKKSLGQHFLNNAKVAEAIAGAALLNKGDVVLEIGPGTGMLTRELIRCGARVVAVEADARAIPLLRETFASELAFGALSLHHGDILKTDLATLGLADHAYKVVANIPYYISGQLFRHFLENPVQPSQIVYLVQKEVAERIARSKKESLLSLGVKAFGIPAYIKTVPRGNFNPPPKVDSAVISISSVSRDNFKGLDREFFFKILHAGFASKRKRLLGNLAKQFGKEQVMNTFSTLHIDMDERAEDLALSRWLELAKKLSHHTHSTEFSSKSPHS